MKKWVVVLWHLAYWFMYSLIVLLVYAGSVHHDNPPRLEGMAALKAVFHVLFISPLAFLAMWPAIIGFYSYYFLLFDNYLTKKRMLSLALLILIISLVTPIVVELALFSLKPGFSGAITGPGIAMAIICLVNGVMGLVLKGFINWYADIKLKRKLKQKNYEMELALMKAQINPHFLFNTLNNIDVLIQKDAAKASEYLNKLSDIMRFMLYETKAEKILLSKEIAYIEKYIELQRIRTSNHNYIHYEIKGDPATLLIEPMLFIPFMENAFKHAEDKKVENAIRIEFVIEKGQVAFGCENSYPLNTVIKPEHSGLGNELIQRRLSLLYPARHTFSVTKANGIYKVNLVIQFT